MFFRSFRFPARVLPIVSAVALTAVLLVLPTHAEAATAVRINTGGPAQTVGGVTWSGCTSSCNGYVKGGNAWSETTPPITGVVAPDSQTIQRSEWTGGETGGIGYGQTAFTFTIPVSTDATYDVKLHFTELNKFAVGQRVFDVKINGSTVLTDFDIFRDAGGAYKTIVRTFPAQPVDGKVVIDFVRKVQNAKISAIQVLPAGTPSSTSTTSSTSTSTTSTTQPPGGGNTLTWTRIADTPNRTLEAAGGAVNGKLYYFGGYLPTYLPMANSYSYSPSSNSWTRLPDMPRALTHMGSVVDGQSFIFAGGYAASNGKQVFGVKNVFRYDTNAKKWSNLPDLPAARGSGGLVKVGRTLHFMGGVDTSRVERSEHWTLDLDNTSEGWKSAPSYPFPRTHFGVVAVGADIYTVGGLIGADANSTAKSGVYRYDTVAKKWDSQVTTTTPKPISHNNASTFTYDGRIWVVTGEFKFATGGSDVVWSYDVTTKQWHTDTSVPISRNAAVVDEIDGTFYIATGTLKNNYAYKGSFK